MLCILNVHGTVLGHLLPESHRGSATKPDRRPFKRHKGRGRVCGKSHPPPSRLPPSRGRTGRASPRRWSSPASFPPRSVTGGRERYLSGQLFRYFLPPDKRREAGAACAPKRGLEAVARCCPARLGSPHGEAGASRPSGARPPPRPSSPFVGRHSPPYPPAQPTPRPEAAGRSLSPPKALLTPKAAPPPRRSGGRPDAEPPALTDRQFKPQHPPPFRKRGSQGSRSAHRRARHPLHRRSAAFAGHAGSAGGDRRSWRSVLGRGAWRAR